MPDPRRLSGAALADALRDSRARTWAMVADLATEQWRMPRAAGVNPFAWELGHIAWFAEFWLLRGDHGVGSDGFVHAARPPICCGPDAVFDSSRLSHDSRWEVDLPTRATLAGRLQAQLEACIAALPEGDDDQALYLHRLVLLHEDMHGEAFAWMRAALGYPAPPGLALRRFEPRPVLFVPAASVRLGRHAHEGGFAFDNELPGATVRLDAFQIDASPVRNADYLRFVESGAAPPQRWRRTPRGDWEQRWFDRWVPLDLDQPVVHVSAHEAEAYCRWAGRRLPTAAEWEHAATTLGRAFDWGHSVWEWTADAFVPYPGFVPGPYKDYSQPWFGNHRELRGGAFATHERLQDARYRNFFLPGRTDVFTGFRTVSGSASD